MKLSRALDYTIEYCFYLLFFLVPLIWLPINYELFEFNKMILTYFLTVIIVGSWFLKILITKEFTFKRTFLDLAVLAFLAANLLSTVFSIDPHTSIFGYYSRFNGGLLSTICYSLLYFALTNNLDRKQALRLLLVTLSSGFLVAVYALLQHPNPFFAKDGVWHGVDYEYWAEQVELRVFSTLGQPNWLAAYLSMLLPLSLSFMLISSRLWEKIFFFLANIAFLLAITFTLSRGGTLGLIAALAIYSLFLFVYPSSLKDRLFRFFYLNVGWPKLLERGWLWLAGFVIALLFMNYQFGNALQARGTTAALSNEAPVESVETKTTQLEVAGAQTGTIRLIVWQGALDIFKHHPLVGTGVETFGYSYYLFRPTAHNMTIEWDFLYNKAHNEYLNYLANNGIIGLGTYLILIGLFIFWSVRYLLKTSVNQERLLVLAILAAYVGYLVQNFFGFSVVILALLFYLLPAAAFVVTEQTRETRMPKNIAKNLSQTNLNHLLQLIVVLVTTYSFLFVARMWLADTYYAQSGSSDPTVNYQNLEAAVEILPSEPLFRSEMAAAAAALASEVDDDELRKDLVEQAATESKNLEDAHPYHTTLARNRLQTIFTLSQIDKKYLPEVILSGKKLAALAPTDASIQYNLALVYMLSDQNEEALKQIEKVLELKPDYQDAKDLQTRLRSS